jgi:hypothetical protein
MGFATTTYRLTFIGLCACLLAAIGCANDSQRQFQPSTVAEVGVSENPPRVIQGGLGVSFDATEADLLKSGFRDLTPSGRQHIGEYEKIGGDTFFFKTVVRMSPISKKIWIIEGYKLYSPELWNAVQISVF